MNSHMRIYERTVYSVMDLLGDVGGFNDAVEEITQVLVGLLTPGIFLTSQIKSIFNIYPMKESDSKKK